MRENILRMETKFKTCTFAMEGNPHWKCVGKRTHRSGRCDLKLYQDDIFQYSLTQRSKLLQILMNVPLVLYVWENPFRFYRDGVPCGSHKFHPSITYQGYREFFFEGNTYTLTIHSRGVHSLLKDDMQVAVYKRYGYGNYIVRYSQAIQDRPDLLMLFAAYVEMYQTLDWPWDGGIEGFTVTDRWPERGNWLPEDETGSTPFLDLDGNLMPEWKS